MKNRWFKHYRYFSILLCFILSTTYASHPSLTSYADLYFILQAKNATLETDTKHPGSYILTLKNAHPQVVYFSDRPQHITGTVPLKKLTFARLKKEYKSFSGILSFYDKQHPTNMQRQVLEIDSYHYLAQKAEVHCHVQFANNEVNAKSYTLKQVILQFDGGWFNLNNL